MLRNYLKITFRNLWRHKGFSFINIMGLAVGMAACFLIFLYVSFEKSYDSFHSNAPNIFRLVTDVKTPSETIHAGITSWPMAPNIKADFPEVEAFTRVQRTSMLVTKEEKKFQEERVLWADSTFFKTFDFDLLKGDPRLVLRDNLNVVLSRSAAKKYFGDADPMGQTLLLYDDYFPAKVSGIMEDFPENSHIKADMLVSMSTLTKLINPDQDNQWSNFDATTYLLLKPGTDVEALEKKFPAFLERHNGKEMRDNKMSYTLFLEPLKEVYMNAERDDAIDNGNKSNVTVFSLIAIFILVIAGINFVNLTTARSTERAKEVGIRKVSGAERGQLMRQFIGESLIISMISLVLALCLVAVLLPLFNQLAGKIVSTGVFSNPGHVLLLFSAAVAIGLLAGVYPSVVLSSFKPVVVLKGRFATGKKGVVLRKGLVVTQFAISIALIIGTIVVYNQMNYMRNQDLGFKKDQMLVVDVQGTGTDALKNEIARLPQVKSVSYSSSVPGSPNSRAYSEVENSKGELQVANLDLYFVDYDYIPQYKIEVVAGRPFSKEFGTDSTGAMIINETAVKYFGYASPEEAIGRRFKQWGREGKIIGVIKDFHFRSLQESIAPLSMRIEPGRFNLLSAQVAADQLPATMAAIENKWKGVETKKPFSYYFLDEFFDRQYRSEERFGTLFLYFAILAIFISCLGLLGLASYSTIQRTKEIGIRKVMGASVGSIVNLLSKDFLLLVAISFFIAAPVAGYFMKGWLNDFAYRTGINWWVFVAGGLAALVIALFTISYQAIRAAMANPSKSLRTE